MLLWEFLKQEAQSKNIHSDAKAAKVWLQDRMPSLFVGDIEQFDWSCEWPRWQANFRALLWLAKKRSKPPKSNQCRIPWWVTQSIDGELDRVRMRLVSDSLGDGIRVWPSRRDGSPAINLHIFGRVDDLDVLWQGAFLSYLDPRAVNASICEMCGEVVPPTKHGSPSKSRVCSEICRTKLWRLENRDKARESNREQKRAQRQKLRLPIRHRS